MLWALAGDINSLDSWTAHKSLLLAQVHCSIVAAGPCDVVHLAFN